MFAPWKKSYDQPTQHIKRQRHYFANKCPSSQSYGFPVVMYRCENWPIKKQSKQTNKKKHIEITDNVNSHTFYPLLLDVKR